VLLRRVVMVLDELDTIASEVRALADSHDVVFTSGGVGPTHDDVTIAAISKAFGVDPVRSPEIEDTLREAMARVRNILQHLCTRCA
jgi:molybdopterin-biosynthesis enzyme MoeA-like protein